MGILHQGNVEPTNLLNLFEEGRMIEIVTETEAIVTEIEIEIEIAKGALKLL
jgi:hypothetical protein